MSSSSSKKQKGGKAETKPVEADESNFVPTAFTGARIQVKNQFAALGDDYEGMEIDRPVPTARARGENRGAKRKAAVKFIQANYTYDYDFSDPKSAKSGSKTGKKQQSEVRTDLAALTERLTQDNLEMALVRASPDASPSARFQMIVETLEKHFLTAKPLTFANNEEHWISFNSPFGEADPAVIGFLTDFVTTELSQEDQTTCCLYLVQRLIENNRTKANGSFGLGYRLASQVLFREASSWCLFSCFSSLMQAFPRVENVCVIPDSDLNVVLFIGAQLLANTDDDAAFAALAYALEILGYTALHKKNVMCLEFLARSFNRFVIVHGKEVDSEYTRLSTAVAKRTLLELSKINLKNEGKNSAFKPILPIIAPLKELVLYMGLLSASKDHIINLWRHLVQLREYELGCTVLGRLTRARLGTYDQHAQHSMKALATELGHQLAGHDRRPPVEAELVDAVKSFVADFKIDVKASQSAKSPSSPSQGRHKHKATHSHRKRSGSCCGLVFRLLFYVALVIGSVYFWRHCVSPWHKDIAHALTKNVVEATKPVVEAIQPKYDAAIAAAHPHYVTALQTVQPYCDAAYAVVKPYTDLAYETVKPHFDQACEAATPHLQLAQVKLAEGYARLLVLLQELNVAAQPYMARALAQGRTFATYLGGQIDRLPTVVSQFYATKISPVVTPIIAPHLNTLDEITKPYLDPVCEAVTPYWNILVTQLRVLGQFLDQHLNVW